MGDEKLLKDIGKRINLRRKELGFTQEELAEYMDVSVQMISNLELGKKAIRPENLVKLCNTLNTSADYILQGKRSEYENVMFIEKYKELSLEQQTILDMIVNSWEGK